MTSLERVLQGEPISPGVAIGGPYFLESPSSSAADGRPVTDFEQEVRRFEAAVEVSREQLRRIGEQVARVMDEGSAQMFASQAEFLRDPELIDWTIHAIRREGREAEYLLAFQVDRWIHLLSELEDEAFRSRSEDLMQVCIRLLGNMGCGVPVPWEDADAGAPVLVAADLTPWEASVLTRRTPGALVLEKSNPGMYLTTMARALGLPVVSGVPGAVQGARDASAILVDGFGGRVILDPSRGTLASYHWQETGTE